MILKNGIVYNDRVYIAENMLDENTKEDLFAFINQSFENGHNTIYYTALFKEFSDKFLTQSIFDPDILREYLKYQNTGTIINEYSVILQDVDAVKNYLYEKVGTEPYLWLGIPEVKKKIQQLAEAQYNKNGYEKALAKIDKMDTEDVKSYIKKLIKDDMILGIQIIKNSH